MDNQDNELTNVQDDDNFFSHQAKLAALVGDESGVTARLIEAWKAPFDLFDDSAESVNGRSK